MLYSSAHTLISLGSVPMTPDSITSAKVSRYNWELHRDTHWWCIHYFLPSGGHILLQRYRDRNGWCIAVLIKTFLKSIWVRVRFDSLDFLGICADVS